MKRRRAPTAKELCELAENSKDLSRVPGPSTTLVQLYHHNENEVTQKTIVLSNSITAPTPTPKPIITFEDDTSVPMVDESRKPRAQVCNPFIALPLAISISSLQNAELLDDFEGEFERLEDEILNFKTDSTIGSPCSCRNGPRMVQCNNCFHYMLTCVDCFIVAHSYAPFHWAEHWDESLGCFV